MPFPPHEVLDANRQHVVNHRNRRRFDPERRHRVVRKDETVHVHQPDKAIVGNGKKPRKDTGLDEPLGEPRLDNREVEPLGILAVSETQKIVCPSESRRDVMHILADATTQPVVSDINCHMAHDQYPLRANSSASSRVNLRAPRRFRWFPSPHSSSANSADRKLA